MRIFIGIFCLFVLVAGSGEALEPLAVDMPVSSKVGGGSGALQETQQLKQNKEEIPVDTKSSTKQDNDTQPIIPETQLQRSNILVQKILTSTRLNTQPESAQASTFKQILPILSAQTTITIPIIESTATKIPHQFIVVYKGRDDGNQIASESIRSRRSTSSIHPPITEIENILREYGSQSITNQLLTRTGDVSLFAFEGAVDLKKITKELESVEGVAYVQPNFIYTFAQAPPSLSKPDPLLTHEAS